MRKAASVTSSDRQPSSSASLTQRLDMMRQLARQAQAKGRRAAARRGRLRPAAQAIVLAWFSLGVLTSGTAGIGVLMGLRALEARGTHVAWGAVGETLGAARTAAWANVPEPAQGPARAWDRVEIAIDRRVRAHAPLGLEVAGAGDRPFEVILDGVPAGVRLSRGAPVAPSVWVVGRADLKGLHLILDDTAPQAFELKIAVTAPAGVAATGSIVQVRLVGERRPTRTAARSWSEGASALGTVQRGSRQPAWWNAPPPARSPVQDGGSPPEGRTVGSADER